MSWLEEGINKILDLSKTEIIDVNGRKYSTNGLSAVHVPTPRPVSLKTLSGLVDYVTNNRDALDLDAMTAHVVSHNLVEVFGPTMFNAFCERDFFAKSEADPGDVFPFGRWLPLEDFNIQVMSRFTGAGDRANIIAVCGKLSVDTSLSVEDDGVSQTVQAKIGVTKLAEVTLPPVVELAPFRTFAEVEQPVSKFLFRMKRDGNSIYAALYEADGGAWRNDAMIKVAEYLKANLPQQVVVIA